MVPADGNFTTAIAKGNHKVGSLERRFLNNPLIQSIALLLQCSISEALVLCELLLVRLLSVMC
eukprot:100075-Amphidinium_carterae.1